jgi:ABC-2 type transport system ATP-binding protein
MSGEAIRVSGLTKDYGTTRAVDGAEFTVEKGEIFSLLGPNGAGKTTTISILSCLARPTAGDASVFGRSVTREAMAVKSSIGLVPQENLLFWGRMQGMHGARLRRRAGEVLDTIGLADRRHGRVAAYSRGMKRRVNIGIALMHEPALLILDEPTVGIDPQSNRHILDSINELSATGPSAVSAPSRLPACSRRAPGCSSCPTAWPVGAGPQRGEGIGAQRCFIAGERATARIPRKGRRR